MEDEDKSREQLVEELVELRRRIALLETSEARRKPLEEGFKLLADNARDMVYRLRVLPERVFEYVNPASTDIVGYTPEDFYNDPDLIFKIVYPDDLPTLERYNRREIALEAPIILRWLHRDGRVIWTEQRNTPIYDEAGNLEIVEGIARDITAGKQAEELLRRNQQLLRKVLDSLPDAVFVLDDATAKIVDCNPATTEIFGYSREEMLGRTTEFLYVDENSCHEFRSQLYSAFEKRGFLERLEFRMRKKDGTVFPTENSASPLEDEQGAFAGLVGIVRDTTKLRQMHESLLRVERQAAMGRLAAALAHEIKNPLQSISSNLELALDFPLTEEERGEHLQAVQQEIERLMSLTNRILYFARPPRIERRPVLVTEVLHHALALANKELQHSHIRLNLDLPDDLPPVPGSRDHLAQVFLNLIINAIEAMPGGGEFNVSARLAGEQVSLSFSDSGPGIEPKALAMLFEPFHTLKESGTGLGLAISHNIIQQHGGNITAANVDGGAAFTITLPVISPQERLLKESE